MTFTQWSLYSVGLCALAVAAHGCADRAIAPSAATVPLGLRVASTPGVSPSSLVLTVRNAGSTPLILDGCAQAPRFDLQRSQGAAWALELSYELVCPANIIPVSVTLQPGDSLTRTFSVADTGTYRALVYVSDGRSRLSARLPSPLLVVR